MTARLRTTFFIAAVAATLFALTVVILGSQRAAAPAQAAASDSPDAAAARAHAAIERNPSDGLAYTRLALASLDQVAETADSSGYVRADVAVRKALAIDPNNVLALEAAAKLANARHRFADAIAPARRAIALAPDRFAAREILTDALIETGAYREGFTLADERLNLRPDLASYSRASYAAELRGEHALALELMTLAADSARVGTGERTWTLVQVGLLHLGDGDVERADTIVDSALAETPNDTVALVGRARVRSAQGNLAEAEMLLTQALAAQPTAPTAQLLAEVQWAKGERDEALVTVERMHELDRREAVNGVRVALDGLAAGADYQQPSAEEVRRARTGHQYRRGVVGDAAFGWVLTRAGQCDEGLRWARRSLRLGTRDALMHFHAGMAARCAGQSDEARRYFRRALEINPAFSPRWAPVARQYAG